MGKIDTKKRYSLRSLEDINKNDSSDLKKAYNYYINECSNKIAILQSKNFSLFEKLSYLSIDITSIQAQIYDGEVFLKQKDDENPRNLRDSIETIEKQKSQIQIDIQIAKEDLKKLNNDVDIIREEIKNNEVQSLKLQKRIETAKEIYNRKLEEAKNEIS